MGQIAPARPDSQLARSTAPLEPKVCAPRLTRAVSCFRGARERLKKGGVLWMVAQQQVPIGRLLAQAGWCKWVEATISKDGRFVVWSAGRTKRAK